MLPVNYGDFVFRFSSFFLSFCEGKSSVQTQRISIVFLSRYAVALLDVVHPLPAAVLEEKATRALNGSYCVTSDSLKATR